MSRGEGGNILGELCQKGIRIWLEDGQLHYRSPAGALSRSEIERLRNCKADIVALLQRTSASRNDAQGTLRPSDRAPLSFSQLAHWQSHELGERPAMRQVAGALRLEGRLDRGPLERAIDALVTRHEALRTRVAQEAGALAQQIDAHYSGDMRHDDLRHLPQREQQGRLQQLIGELILEPIDVTTGPLFGVRLASLASGEHVLMVAMEHLVSDGFSLNILWRDLLALYARELDDSLPELATVPVQFADYAAWQRGKHDEWLSRHARHWDERLAGCTRVRFPDDPPHATMGAHGWGLERIHVERELKAELLQWCRAHHTTQVMTVFTVYVALVMRWCDVADAVIRFQVDGRGRPELLQTVGYFASALCLRIGLSPGASFLDLLAQVTQEYCRAYERTDCGYLATLVPRPDFLRNPAFNWLPHARSDAWREVSEQAGQDGALKVSTLPFTFPLRTFEMDLEPSVLFTESEETIVGEIYFSRRRFSSQTMERFARSFRACLLQLLRAPDASIDAVALD
jgi:hypothetical protein